MLSVSRTARRSAWTAATLLVGLAAGSLARAENISPQELEDNRKTCMSSCPATIEKLTAISKSCRSNLDH